MTMDEIKNIRIDDYDYALTEEKIARFPIEERDHSKILIYRSGHLQEDRFYRLDEYLQNQLLVYNDTKVIQARMEFKKDTGGRIEIFCLEPQEPSDYESAFRSTKPVAWKCLVGNLKKWKNGDLKKTIQINHDTVHLHAFIERNEGTHQLIRFSWNNADVTFAKLLEHAGKTPIPPYLKRESERIDKERYQTVYSRVKGSVAAPTAGLHFTDRIFEKLKNKNIRTEKITLHVGAGTFQPVKEKYAYRHPMHTEWMSISKKSLESFLNSEEIIAVGTTTLRAMESIYWIGHKLMNGKHDYTLSQLEPYQMEETFDKKEILQAIIQHMNHINLTHIQAKTRLMIVPGYHFKMVDGLITNFHQPKSTLLLLVAAFIGEDWKKVYEYALEHDFRLLSYGDSSLLIPY